MILRDNYCTVSDLECPPNLLDTPCLQGPSEKLLSKFVSTEFIHFQLTLLVLLSHGSSKDK